MIVKELDILNISSTINLVNTVISTLSNYSVAAREAQLKAFSFDNFCKHYISDANRYNIIATENEKVVGFLFGKIEQFEDTKMFYVEWMGVDDSYRNKRIKRVGYKDTVTIQLLWDKMESLAISKNLDGILGDTLTTNKKAIKFAQKNGMNIWKEIKNHWYGHDYFLMGKFYGKPDGQL